MQKKQNVVISIAQGSITSLENDRKSWEQNPQISRKVTEISNDIKYAWTLNSEIEALKTSVQTVLLKNMIQVVLNSTNMICCKVQIYAHETSNKHIISYVHFTLKQLGQGSIDKVLDRCSTILSKTESYLSDLQAHGVTQEELNLIHVHIAECRHLFAERIAMQSERTIKLKKKNDLIHKINSDMNILDKMTEVFISDKSVVDRYKNSRTSKRFIGNRTKKKKETTDKIAHTQV